MSVSLFFLIFIVVSHGNNQDIMRNYIQEQGSKSAIFIRSGEAVLEKAVERKLRKM